MEFYLEKTDLEKHLQRFKDEGFTLKTISENELYNYLVDWLGLTEHDDFDEALEMLENGDFNGLDGILADPDNYYKKINNNDTIIEVFYDNMGDGNNCITIFAAKDYHDSTFFLFSCNGMYSSWNETSWDYVNPVKLESKEVYFINTN